MNAIFFLKYFLNIHSFNLYVVIVIDMIIGWFVTK
jgi:hypothetical protein